MSATATYHLRPVSTMTRSASPTASSSTVSDRSPPPLGAHHPPSKAMLPPSTTSHFSPIPSSARPRRPLSPSSLRDVDIPLDPERAFAARGKYPAPPTGHELMALFPPAPPMIRLGSTSGFFEREERKFFAQAGKEIVRVRLEVESLAHGGGGGGGRIPPPGSMASPPNLHVHTPHARAQSLGHSHPHSHPHPHAPPPPAHTALPPPPAPLPHTTSPRSHLPPNGGAFPAPAPPVGSPMGPPPVPAGPAHPGYPISRPPELERNPGGGSEAMVVEDDDDDAWRRPTPHNARRRAGKHTRRVIVK